METKALPTRDEKQAEEDASLRKVYDSFAQKGVNMPGGYEGFARAAKEKSGSDGSDDTGAPSYNKDEI